MSVAWFSSVSATDVETVGGKAASLGELSSHGLPIPPGFTVTADTYRRFIEGAGIAEELFEVVDVDPEDSRALATAEQRAAELILEAEWPEDARESIHDAFDDLGEDPTVAVRSSATAEDLPDASFAGQQDTYLNITRDELLDRIKRCWASLFTQRALYYREEQGFDHSEVDIAVVVQKMVDAEKSGVLFTSHPSTGAAEMTVEAAWGLGEAVVSGSVSPDHYTYDRRDETVESVTISTKKTMHVKDPDTGETLEKPVPAEKRDERVLSEGELDLLSDIGELVEDHYGQPQDVEWAINDGNIYLLQSRPITTIDEESADDGHDGTEDSQSMLVDGLGASPGTVSGTARIVGSLDQLDKVNEGDVIVSEATTPDMMPAMKRASAIVTDEGGLTSHAAIVSRELGVPAIVGTPNATTTPRTAPRAAATSRGPRRAGATRPGGGARRRPRRAHRAGHRPLAGRLPDPQRPPRASAGGRGRGRRPRPQLLARGRGDGGRRRGVDGRPRRGRLLRHAERVPAPRPPDGRGPRPVALLVRAAGGGRRDRPDRVRG